MATRQTTIRFSERTDQQLEELAGLFGDRTKAITVAVDRMYREEITITKGEDAMEIRVEFSEAALFGDVDPEAEGINTAASVANFAEALTNHLYTEYSRADDIVVQASINDRVLVNGTEDHEEVVWIEEIINEVWNGDDWIVS